MEKVNLCIMGSRTINNQKAYNILEKEVLDIKPDLILTSGDAEGICQLGIQVAKKHSIPLQLHFLDRKKGRGKYYHRSKSILSNSNFAIFIHNGTSKGTKNEIEMAKKMKIKYKYILFKENSSDFLSDFFSNFNLSI